MAFENDLVQSGKTAPVDPADARKRKVLIDEFDLRSTTAELIRVMRHNFPDADRQPAGHPLHTVRHPVIPTHAVQLGHRHQMPGQVLRQPISHGILWTMP